MYCSICFFLYYSEQQFVYLWWIPENLCFIQCLWLNGFILLAIYQLVISHGCIAILAFKFTLVTFTAKIGHNTTNFCSFPYRRMNNMEVYSRNLYHFNLLFTGGKSTYKWTKKNILPKQLFFQIITCILVLNDKQLERHTVRQTDRQRQTDTQTEILSVRNERLNLLWPNTLFKTKKLKKDFYRFL